MKRYKLLKWYPSLPEDMEVGEKVTHSRIGSGGYVRNSKRPQIYMLGRNEVENNPEFWEEVVEKDYQILEVQNNCNKQIYGGAQSSLLNKLKTNKYSILKVKRLSDGEVFTVGDRISHRSYSSNLIIESFVIEKDKSMGTNLTCGNYYALGNLKHIKKPLFTTEDGVDLYKGDAYFYIFRHGLDTPSESRVGERLDRHDFDTFVYFSTREKAEEYIDYNRLRYSKKDIVDAVHKVGHMGFNGLVEQFCKIINDKELFKELGI